MQGEQRGQRKQKKDEEKVSVQQKMLLILTFPSPFFSHSFLLAIQITQFFFSCSDIYPINISTSFAWDEAPTNTLINPS